jgi:hypothetical protein
MGSSTPIRPMASGCKAIVGDAKSRERHLRAE